MSGVTVQENLRASLQNNLQDNLEGGVQHGELIVREHGTLRRITLNRPKALNALTLDMSITMTALLHAWAADPAVGAVLLDGAGERGLCAGGDIRALYDAAKSGDTLPEKFWATEYYLDVLVARYPKPFVAVMDGMVMGGGVGLSAYAAHRVVTERSAVTAASASSSLAACTAAMRSASRASPKRIRASRTNAMTTHTPSAGAAGVPAKGSPITATRTARSAAARAADTSHDTGDGTVSRTRPASHPDGPGTQA